MNSNAVREEAFEDDELLDVAYTDAPTLTKAELSELLFERIGLNKRESKDMVDQFFKLLHDALTSGHDVKLSGFGNFHLRDKSQRPGRNPRTGEAIPIKARRVVTFHTSHKLKELVQTGGGLDETA
jgi:integration host factor subunit alpha